MKDLEDRNRTSLPRLYEPWIAEALGGEIPTETEATCDDCAMCPPADEAEAETSSTYFDPAIKCCTYYPELPSFLAGMILADDDPAAAEGRSTLTRIIGSGVGVTPLGLRMPLRYRLIYLSAEDAYGRAAGLRCPFYIGEPGGLCGIWPHRMAVCATWFCKHSRGATGGRFWQALQSLLLTVERDLAIHCALEAGLSPEPLAECLPSRTVGRDPLRLQAPDVDQRRDEGRYRALWGGLAEAETRHYVESAERVAHLSWSEVLAIGSPELRAWLEVTRSAHAAILSTELPHTLHVGTYEVLQADAETVLLRTHNPNDPLTVPRALVDVLHYFEDRAPHVAIAAIAAEEGIEVEPDLVRMLVDFAVLVPADEHGASAPHPARRR